MFFRLSQLPFAAIAILQLSTTPLVAQSLVGDGTIVCGGTYTVESGDTLSTLADRAYGSGDFYTSLLDANDDQLGGDADHISVGMEIEIPCLDASGEVSDVDIQTAIDAEGPLSTGELDALFGPVALFPDPVLNPILIAVTVPLDVVKAGRFVTEAADMTDDERSAAASEKDWDPSVRALAAAYPDLVTKMSDHIDWTEQAGEAVLAQTDDVLDTIQRLRSEAMDNGYLVDNQAQTVEVTDDIISIAPAQPQVIYVPTYDPQVVYTTPISTAPAFYYDDDDDPYYYDDWDNALAAGAIFLGTAVVLDEIFDDDDWGDIGGWDGDDIDVDWDRGEINIDRGDIDIDRGDIDLGDINIDRDNLNIDRDNINIGNGDRNRVTIGGDRDRTDIGDRDRPNLGDGDRPNRDQIRVDADRDAARQRIEARQATGGDVARLPANRPEVNRPRTETRQPAGNRDTLSRPHQQQRPAVQQRQTERQPQQRVQQRRQQDNAFARHQRPSGGNRQPSRNRPNRR